MSDKQPEKAAEANEANDSAETETELAAETDETGETGETDAATAALESELEILRGEVAEQNDRLLRTLAELDNLRKRTRREVSDARRFAQADLLRPLLDILDNFERALAADADQDDADQDGAGSGGHEAFRTGVAMIAQSFRQALQDQGVQPIAAEGEAFDPALHEAVGQQPAPEGVEPGTVLAVAQQGYTLGELVLRASRVIVAQ
jgi:molecular chaperone GrpE